MASQASASRPEESRATGYAWYVLALLFLVYCLNFIDRQIPAILAEDIKRDLHLQDQDIGFLYGAAFGVFYSLFGIPLGRLADNWHRVRLLTVGLTLWSAMTAASGFAGSGAALGAARIGVGVGEATASPSAYSLLSDWFPRRLRATALAIYSAGIYVGGGFSLGVGGLIVQRWDRAYPAGGPLGLHGWQAAFLAVGIPGLLLALWVATLREPVRGRSDGIPTPPHPRPFGAFVDELIAVVPPFTLIGAGRRGARALATNVAVAVGLALLVSLLVHLGEPVAQWTAVAIGVYAVTSWASNLRRHDPPAFALTVGSRAFWAVVIAYGLNAFIAYAISAWAATYARRTFGVSPAEAGLWLGGPAALAGLTGIVGGGRMADWLRERYPAGRQIVVLFGGIAPLVPLVIGFTTTSPTLFYVMVALTGLLAPVALGASAATTQDLVLPRMRGAATAVFFLGTTLLGLALGPYLVGRVSTLSGDLGLGVLSTLVVAPIGIIAGIVAYRLVPAAEASRIERARAAGEAD
ncbi:MAG: MFS transporter [Janthinobacterium lividum]